MGDGNALVSQSPNMLFHPQYHTLPSIRTAREKLSPVVISITPSMMGVGGISSSNVLFPTCPAQEEPKPYTHPLAASISPWSYPAFTLTMGMWGEFGIPVRRMGVYSSKLDVAYAKAFVFPHPYRVPFDVTAKETK